MDKEAIKRFCLNQLDKQLKTLKDLMQEVQQASNLETKSTAGDKHDTARAHAQNEVERLGKQVQQLESSMQDLLRLPVESHNKVQRGSLVKSSCGDFYIAVALLPSLTSHQQFIALSPSAPLAQRMLGRAVGDEFLRLDGVKCKILGVH